MHSTDEIPQIAILVDTATGWGRRIIKGIITYVEKEGPWHIWVRSADAGHVSSLPKGWKGQGIIARVSDAEIAKSVDELNLPVVNVSGIQIDGFSAPCVTSDYTKAAEVAHEHLLNRGFRNFGYVAPTTESFVKQHRNAFRQVLEDRGYSCDTFTISDSPEKDLKALQLSLRGWVKSLPKPVGVFAWGASIGREVIDACLWEGIAVPYDVAVLGGDFDDLLNEACYPALSGIVTAAEQIGYNAAKALHEMMQGKEVPHTTTFMAPSGLEQRLSTDTIAIDDPQLCKVVNYLRTHAYEQITVTDILKQVPMARRVLERRFRQVFGRTPLEEIRRLRIDRARKLLTDTDMPMQEIAEACGYATYNYLTHTFKRVTGMSPTSYRKQWRIHK